MQYRICNAVGCRTLVKIPEKYCDYHKRSHAEWLKEHQVKPETNKQRYKRRMYGHKEGKYQQFYKSTLWRKLSRKMLIKYPVCQLCMKKGIIKKADVVDHIIPIRQDWDKRLDESNLQTLCASCHRRKTNKDLQRAKKNKWGPGRRK